MKKLIIYILCGFYMTLSTAWAENSGDIVSLQNKQPNAEDIIEGLIGNQESDLPAGLIPANRIGTKSTRGIHMGQSKDRSFSRTKQTTLQQANSEAPTGCPISSGGIALNIAFDSGSYNITPEGFNTLNEVVKAFENNKLAQCQFIVEGHTDATGEEKYNQWLSEKRAEAVQGFLLHNNIAAERLSILGKGERELLNVSNPYDSMNRRVQFRINN